MQFLQVGRLMTDVIVQSLPSLKFKNVSYLVFLNETKTSVLQLLEQRFASKKFCKYLAAIDGKVLNTIRNTPLQMCGPYPPVQMWSKKWRINQSSPEGQAVQVRKKRIQDAIRVKIDVLVDVVLPNSGTTNDGNTSRIVLADENRITFADILWLELWLIDGLHIILIVISCGIPVDADKLGTFCKDLAYKYVSVCDWHPMTVSIHKILIHGASIIDKTPLPIGMLSEEAAESRNKYWRSDWEHHTRKEWWSKWAQARQNWNISH